MGGDQSEALKGEEKGHSATIKPIYGVGIDGHQLDGPETIAGRVLQLEMVS